MSSSSGQTVQHEYNYDTEVEITGDIMPEVLSDGIKAGMDAFDESIEIEAYDPVTRFNDVVGDQLGDMSSYIGDDMRNGLQGVKNLQVTLRNTAATGNQDGFHFLRILWESPGECPSAITWRGFRSTFFGPLGVGEGGVNVGGEGGVLSHDDLVIEIPPVVRQMSGMVSGFVKLFNVMCVMAAMVRCIGILGGE